MRERSVVGDRRVGNHPESWLNPVTPQKCAGRRTEPAPSVPRWSGPQPEAARAAAPDDEPPAVSPCRQGLWVAPVSGLSLTAVQPCSVVVVLPRITAPAARSLATAGASAAAGAALVRRDPLRVGRPATACTSLIVTGTPWSGPSGPPFMTASSAWRAALSAPSLSRTTRAFIRGSWRSMRESTDWRTSTGETFRARTSAAKSWAERSESSSDPELFILYRMTYSVDCQASTSRKVL